MPIQADFEEGGRTQMKQKRAIEPPPAFDEDDAAAEARVRLKIQLGEPLTAEDRAILGRLPGDRDVRYQ